MAAIAPINIVGNNAVVAHVWTTLGLNANQINALDAEGTDSLRSFSMLKSSAVTDMTKRLSSLPTNRGGVRIGAVTACKLQATLFWVHERKRANRPLDSMMSDEFTVDTCEEHVEIGSPISFEACRNSHDLLGGHVNSIMNIMFMTGFGFLPKSKITGA